MVQQKKQPFSGIAFGWERSAQSSAIGFTTATAKPVKSSRRKMIVDETEAHVLVVAPTGSGKGRNLMIPTLLTSHAPAVIIDVKGEAAAVTAAARRAMGHDVHILDPFKIVTENADTFNPLDVISPDEMTIGDEALEIAEGIVGTEGSHRDRFWDNWARSVISAVIEFAVTDDDEPANVGQIWSRLNGEDVPYNLAVLLDSGRIKGLAYNNIAGFLGLPERETRPSVLGTVQQHIRLFGSPAVKNAMEKTSFDLSALREGRPQTIYLVIPPNKLASHAPMLRMWLWALMSIVVQREKNPPVPTLFIIDEMAHLGAMPILEQSVTLMRGYGVRLMLLLQNIGQLQKLYPNDNGTIASNCLVAATFGTTSPIMARPMAELLGDVTAEQLLAMPHDTLALRQRSGPTRFLTKLDYLKDRKFAGLYKDNPRYSTNSDRAYDEETATHMNNAGDTTADGGVVSGFKAVRDANAEIMRLENCIANMRKKGQTPQLKVHLEKLAKARKALVQLEAAVRDSIPEIFTPSECNLPKGKTVTRTHQPTKIHITLHGSGNKRMCKMTFQKLAVGSKMDVQCRPEDVNLRAYLIVQGEEALMVNQSTPKPDAASAWTR
ncbi:MAG: type IV secretory system conjugative DNA transfer family protein [Pseudomonadota bacterium]